LRVKQSWSDLNVDEEKDRSGVPRKNPIVCLKAFRIGEKKRGDAEDEVGITEGCSEADTCKMGRRYCGNQVGNVKRNNPICEGTDGAL